jgi:cytochrome c-type biogenesis protein CcmH
VLWPLSRRPEHAVKVEDPNTQFYQDQIAEIERDLDRGVLSASEAEAARAEAARRLLRAAERGEGASSAVGEPALRRRRAVSALTLSLVPLVALAVYGVLGSPHLPGQPRAARVQVDPQQLDLGTLIGQIEAHLAKNPEDGRGWEVVAPVYLRLGRAEDAAQAYQKAIRYLGPDANRLAQYGQALVASQEGMVSAEARAAFEQAVSLDAASPTARFYLAQAAEQDGNRDKARAQYEAVLAAAPPDAPWAPVIRERLARLDGPTGAPAAQSGVSSDAIAGMVRGLAERLESQGGTPEEWTRLMRSYVVLEQPQEARATLGKARHALAGNQSALSQIDAMARELKISDDFRP